MNVKVTISYDGSKFLGSQKQPNKRSVEDKILETLKCLNIEPKITLSGRTDKDVHATSQVFNLELPEYWKSLEKFKDSLNRGLPNSIRVRRVLKVDESFHARFSAKKRVYRYIVTTKELNPFNESYMTYHKSVDLKRVQEVIKHFLGVHDFEYFHKRGSDKHNFVKEIYEARVYKYRDVYVFKFCANSYLRSQIRLMVGSLLAISDGTLSEKEFLEQLNKKREVFRKLAPANGLYLSKVIY